MFVFLPFNPLKPKKGLFRLQKNNFICNSFKRSYIFLNKERRPIQGGQSLTFRFLNKNVLRVRIGRHVAVTSLVCSFLKFRFCLKIYSRPTNLTEAFILGKFIQTYGNASFVHKFYNYSDVGGFSMTHSHSAGEPHPMFL